MKAIDIGKEFFFRLANRNELQGDGKYNAVDFRNRYLSDLDSQEIWNNDNNVAIILSFKNVKRIGPSFANEAFAYFMQYTDPTTFRNIVKLVDLDEVDELIIKKELESGYKNR